MKKTEKKQAENIDEEELDLPPSKTSIKKMMHELQDVGEELLALSPAHVKRMLEFSEISLSESLAEAINQARKIKPGNGLRRQIQRIGKLIRKENHEEIQAALENFKNHSAQQPKTVKPEKEISAAEHWGAEFLMPSKNSEALSDFIKEHPNCDRQQLNQLIRNAQKEAGKKTIEKKETGTGNTNNKKNYRRLIDALNTIIRTN